MTSTPFPAHPSSLFDTLVTHSSVQLLAIFLLAVTLIFSKLGGTGLANYDDAFYAQKAKEILTTHDWMTMHYNGRPAFENPPFFMWCIAVSYKIFGVNEYAAKFPSAFFGTGTVLLVFFFGRYLFNQWTGFFSAAILSTTIMFTRFASRAMMDVTLSFFVTLALFSFVLSSRGNRRYFLLWGISIAVCILTKSVLGFFPAIISLLFIVVKKRWDLLKETYAYVGIFLILVFGCSWYYAEYFLYGDVFIRIHFGWLILERGLLLESQAWYEHLSYGKDLLTYDWPWLPLFVWGFWIALKNFKKEEMAILVLWCATIVITMSMMKSRVMWYILPIIPAASMLSGNVAAHFLSESKKILSSKILLAVAYVAIIIIDATPIRLSQERETDIRVLAPYVKYYAQRGCTIIGYGYDYYSLNNALMFYSDHAAEPIYRDVASLQKALASSDTVLVVIDSNVLSSLPPSFAWYDVVRKTDEMSLLSNHKLNISGIRTW